MKQMLTSANKYKKNDFVAIIVDNGSNDVDQLDIKDIIKLPENIGFAAGNNVGLKEIENRQPKDEDIVIFINSDIEIQEQDWDEKFVELFKNKTIGVAGCAYHPLSWTKDARFQIKPISKTPVLSEGVQGAFFGVKWEILKKVKENDMWFDEGFFFAQYEEMDLQFRIIDLGLKCVWFNLAHLHKHNNSATKKNGYKLSKDIKNIDDFKANAERNRLRLIQKHPRRFS